MANMSYCRFENTYKDLLDCLNAMNNELSEREAGYRERLVDVCKEIIDEYELNKMSEEDDEYDDFQTYNEAPYGQDDEDNNDEVSWDTQTR